MRFTLFALSLCLFALPAAAQDDEQMIYTPGSTFKNEAVNEIRRLKKESLAENNFIKPDKIEVALVKASFMDEDQFGVLMSVPKVVSGCWELSPLQYEATFIDPYYLDIKVKDYQRTAIETDNVSSGCPSGNKMSTAMMVLNRSDLTKRGTQQIRFSNGVVTDYYDIAMTDRDLSLKPQSMVVFKAKNLEGPMKDHMTFGFAGSDRIALHVPMAHKGEDIKAAITRFASQNALTSDADNPMSYDDSGAPVFYFKDISGRMVSSIGEDGYIDVGSITVGRPYDGPNGRTLTGVPLQVFATLPGTDL